MLVHDLGSRGRQADLREFKASLVYKMSSRKARAVTQRNPISKKQQQQQKSFIWTQSSGPRSKGYIC